MGSRRIRGVRFQAFSGDHPDAAIPHLHARFAGAEIILELLPDGTARPSQGHRSPIRGKVSESDERRVLKIAEDAYDELILLWSKSQP